MPKTNFSPFISSPLPVLFYFALPRIVKRQKTENFIYAVKAFAGLLVNKHFARINIIENVKITDESGT
jgi:hypothetical protein